MDISDRFSRHNLSAAALVEHALRGGEGLLAAEGSLVVSTGSHTGRSPNDKYIVRDKTSESTIWWDNNRALSPALPSRGVLFTPGTPE